MNRVALIGRFCWACVIFSLTLEISARVDDFIKYDAPLWGEYTADRLRGIDAEGIGYNIPHRRFEKWKNNAFGFRGPALPIKKPDGIVRIACVGTSETYGFFESPDKEWPAQLQDFLSQDSRFQIMNTSVIGLGLQTYQPYIEKYVLLFKPDVIVILINPYSYATGRERASKTPLPLTPHTATFRRPPSKPALSLQTILAQMRILPKTKGTIKQLLPPNILKLYQIRDTEKQVRAAEALRLKGASPKSRIPDSTVQDYRKDLTGLVNFLKGHNIQVILSTYPTLISAETIETSYEIIMDNRKFCVEFSFDGMLDVAQQLNNMTKTVATEAQIGFIDSDRVLPKDTQHFGDNVHYTGKGARLLAQQIAGYAIQHYAINQPIPDNF